ncbi:AI-2E family transporter [Lacticigenium naphthae]|uniref:AI-2E family transporter n=1 Tax=Lacticigenium naphthae TaxID=515351 RepID=UPI000422EC94|nr:AI-2E family transporter [Lacticigenium naphthae]
MEKGSNEGDSTELNQSRLWKVILNNKFMSFFITLLIVFLTILVFTKIAYLFSPISIIVDTVGPPILFAGIFYYLLNPVVDWLEERKFTRISAIMVLTMGLVLLIVLGINFLFPILREQTQTFVREWPEYWRRIVTQVDTYSNTQIFSGLSNQFFQTDFMSALSEQISNILNATVGGIGSVIGTVTSFFITLFTTPFILYYLLKDGDKFASFFIKFIPVPFREKSVQVFKEMNQQVSSYVRGQLVVAFFVALMFWIGFSIIGLDYALSIGVLAGILNLIPYLGSALATIPALIIGIVASPFMLLKVLLVFGIEQLLEGRLVSPQILGNNLKIHPITIIFLLLTAGRLFGVMGIILGIPGYAILKIIFTHLFEWYKNYSGLYDESRF